MQFEKRPVDAEFVHLMHCVQSTGIIGHKYRGYTLLTQDGRNLRSITVSTLMWHGHYLFVYLNKECEESYEPLQKIPISVKPYFLKTWETDVIPTLKF